MLGERNAFEQKGKEDETLQRSIGKYLYWRSQKVFPGTTTQQLPAQGCIDVSPCRALCQQKAISYTTEAVFVDGSGLPHSWDERHR